MDFFQVMLLLTGITGAAFIVYSIINFHGKKQPDESRLDENMNISNKITEFDSTIKDADDLYNNLDSLKNDVMKEFDLKYQEMLFLYNLIDDKKKELADVDIAQQPQRKPLKTLHGTPESGMINENNSIHEVNTDLAGGLNEYSLLRGGTFADAAETTPTRPIQSAIRNPRLEQIIKLKEEGKTVTQIAKNLNMGKGEVMLLLNISGQS